MTTGKRDDLVEEGGLFLVAEVGVNFFFPAKMMIVFAFCWTEVEVWLTTSWRVR